MPGRQGVPQRQMPRSGPWPGRVYRV